jgi:endoglucanase
MRFELLATLALASSALAQTRKLKWFGINESGAEFGEATYPGTYGKEYIWYDFNTIDQFIAQGMNMFRLNFGETPSQIPQRHGD